MIVLSRRLPGFFLVALLLVLAGPLWAEARTPRWATQAETRLKAAVTANDSIAIEREANRLGVGGVRRMLASSEPKRVGVALRGAIFVDKSWYLLADVAKRGGSGDEKLARLALAVCRRIGEDLRRVELGIHEESASTLRPAVNTLLGIARDRRRPAAVRADALLALAAARGPLVVSDGNLLSFLRDPVAEVRRAAVECFAGAVGPAARVPLARLVASDADPRVASGAAAALCAGLPAKGAERSLYLASLKSSGATAKLHTLVTDAPIDEQVDIARCLQALRTPAARRALSRLRRQRGVRRALRRIGR